jgi:hypothetical protein
MGGVISDRIGGEFERKNFQVLRALILFVTDMRERER